MHSLKVFGSLAFASTLHMHRTKLEPRGRKCVFLGYKNGMKGVVLYDINSHTILVSRNVIHHEHIFPYSNANSTNWNYHPYKDPIDSPQHDPIIPIPSQSIESTVEEHDHHPNTTIDTLHHSNIDPESLENADENHDIQSIPDTSDIENDNINLGLLEPNIHLIISQIMCAIHLMHQQSSHHQMKKEVVDTVTINLTQGVPQPSIPHDDFTDSPIPSQFNMNYRGCINQSRGRGYCGGRSRGCGGFDFNGRYVQCKICYKTRH
ncbi:hypothetical protein KIW84_045282 [Lathyrus oleraceus]|uniref:Retroviral polymerase SH3-like domain-containing protein n=1 Tax=Pisum sativum TaxID=3888 RepID=A0A9D4XIQ5_PEA|nr:hypothetical protein KIW84_045282 [Pisum sativum]